jgi:HEAT repeat protein
MPESYWQDMLHSRDVDTRIEALCQLNKACPKSEFPHPAVVAALKDENADVRLEAAELLNGSNMWDEEERPPPEAARAAPALISALKDKHAGVRKQAAQSILAIVGCHGGLKWHQTKAEELRKKLRKALRSALHHEDAMVRENASRVLGFLRSQKPE